MKRILLSVAALLCGLSAIAQSKAHKLGISAGFGPQDYYGDLGNGFRINDDTGVWRGAVALNINYYLNRSFDVRLFGSVGDYAYCQSDARAAELIEDADRCPGCAGRVGMGNLQARLHAIGASARYKIANGYLLKENVRIRPYLFAGAALNVVTDRMKKDCVKPGNYLSLNGGLGAQYYLTSRINVGYQLSMGYFTNDELDFMHHGAGDLYMQNLLMVGFDF